MERMLSVGTPAAYIPPALCYELADTPEPPRFIGDYVEKLFRKEELCALYASHASRVWEYAVQIVRTFMRAITEANRNDKKYRACHLFLLVFIGQTISFHYRRRWQVSDMIIRLLQYKSVLIVSPSLVFPALDKLRQHFADNQDLEGMKLLDQPTRQTSIHVNERGIPNLWYRALPDGHYFFV